jgi:hypothetical protein
MERKTPRKKENLLPRSLLEDIEYDELDKEMQLLHISDDNNKIKEGMYIF